MIQSQPSADESQPSTSPPDHSSPTLAARPGPRLSAQALTTLLIIACLVPLFSLSGYALFFGKARDAELLVEVTITQRGIAAAGLRGAILTDVIVIRNRCDHELPNVTIDINGQYFLHRQSPIGVDEELVLPQQIFATKSNQRWVPGRYSIDKVTVTARLPSGRRGVHIHHPNAAAPREPTQASGNL